MANIDEILDLVRQTGLESFRETVKSESYGKETLLRELNSHPDAFRTYGRNSKLIQQMRRITLGIDSESIKEKKAAAAQASRVSDEQLAERAEIEQGEALTNKFHEDHKEVHKKWLNTFQPERDGDEI